MGVNAGDLDHEFTLQSPGCDDKAPWIDIETMWGNKRYVSGNETLRDAALSATGQFIVSVYYRTDIRADMSLYEAETGTRLQIVSYGDPDGSRQELRIVCIEQQ